MCHPNRESGTQEELSKMLPVCQPKNEKTLNWAPSLLLVKPYYNLVHSDQIK